ncbi:MAG TPA: hypothetical protein VFB38_15035 [Chthonomonadaceae bacterium]|nr:hypothetical protein [Chthonomonadaceae bacterium]
MSTSKQRICPKCGAAMNHHAEKVDYSGDTAAFGTDNGLLFGGVLLEIHTCPRCGYIGSWPAAASHEAERQAGA